MLLKSLVERLLETENYYDGKAQRAKRLKKNSAANCAALLGFQTPALAEFNRVIQSAAGVVFNMLFPQTAKKLYFSNPVMSFFNNPIKSDDTGDDILLSSYRQRGDLADLAKLYHGKVPLVYGVCLKYLKDEEQAKDAVMAIFEELVEKVKRHEIKHFRSWLYVLVRNHCLMQLRAEKKLEVVNLDDVMEFTPLLHPDTVDREEALVALAQCIEKLPRKQQQSVSLFYLKEKCYQEITEVTGFSLKEVKSYIQNGKRNLKICLEKVSG